LGLLTFLSGLNSLRTQKVTGVDTKVSNGTLLAVGGVTGFLSSLTGTGGPLVLVPIMISMSVPVLTAVGLSQAIQLPVAVAATLGNVLYGKLDLTLGGVLAVGLTVGSWFGAKLAHIVPRTLLRRIVSVVLLMIGAFILIDVGWRLAR
ncbi:MAG: sulfite exporter TauE/SafE family protein, partial [Xanthobacteraceae bacterium]